MVSVNVELHNIEGTGATVGRAGSHAIVIDRPEGRAGGQGIGFNGGELMALTLGGCLCNDLHYVAHEMGVALGRIAVSVHLELEGDPPQAAAATIDVTCETADGRSADEVIERARASSFASNSVTRGFTVAIRTR